MKPKRIKRKITLNLALAPLEHNGVKVNIIDTPGYADFIGDAIAGMAAAEMALFVVDAVAGPQVQTRKLWKLATEMGVAKAVFINRMDKEHADFAAAMKALEDAFGHRVGAVQIPIGSAEDFRGVVDIIRMKAYHHEEDREHILEIPNDLKDAAESARDKLCELVAEADDDLMMKYLEGERLTQEELETLLGKAIAQSMFIPVFVGSAITMQGVEDLLDDIVTLLPGAHRTWTAHCGGRLRGPHHHQRRRRVHVFKTLSDPYVGRMNFVKVVSGTLRPGDELINSRTGKKERVAHVYKMTGKEMTSIEAAPAGDIAVLTKLSDTLTNDTLSANGDLAFEPLPLPEPLYPVAIVAKTKATRTSSAARSRASSKRIPPWSCVVMRRPIRRSSPHTAMRRSMCSSTGSTTASMSRPSWRTSVSPIGRPSARPRRPRAATRSRPAAAVSSPTAGSASSRIPAAATSFLTRS